MLSILQKSYLFIPGHEKDDIVVSNKGVLQGSPLAAYLFNIAIGNALYANEKTRKIIEMGLMDIYADDITQLAKHDRVKKQIKYTATALLAIGLDLNKSKTELLCREGTKVSGMEEQMKTEITVLGMDVCNTREKQRNLINRTLSIWAKDHRRVLRGLRHDRDTLKLALRAISRQI